MNNFFYLSQSVYMLHQWACQKIEMVLFGLVVIFLDYKHCVTEFGIKTNVPI